ncbi:MAG TPA: hypothetical protein VE734_01205 [Terriglobales bacterium]|nr:hypothetical protein [Terriglobales bacterium]
MALKTNDTLFSLFLGMLLTATLANLGLAADRAAKSDAARAKAPAVNAPSAAIDQNLFKGLEWRSIGPYRGGRVLAVAGVPGDPTTYYFGGVAGGVWKSTDSGHRWKPLFEHERISSIGAIAVADSNPNIIYVGSGEACIRGNISYGNGVYKSIDGGRTWKHVGLEDTRHIGALIIHPRNPDIVYVAALGHAYGRNSERGVFRTTDGGKSWQKVLYKDDQTGAIDVVFDPHNPNILFAALWQVQRTPWSLESGGPGSGLYKSVDGGSTWKRLEGNGLPKGVLGRIGVSVSGADSDRVYALIEAEEGGLYRSDDGGEHWTKVNDDQRLRQRAWYFTHVFADPKSRDTVYLLNTGLFRSTDGGATLTLLPAPHGDHHGLWIDPTNPERMINGNDGGATVTTDGGKSWSLQNNQPTAQFYHVIADNRFPYYVYGAQQDNSTVAIATYDDQGTIGRRDWYDVGGGESGYIAPDPRDANVVYAGSGGGYVTRFDKRIMQAQDISPWPMDAEGHGASSLKYRLGWTEPLLVSVHDPDVIYTAGEVLFRSKDHGMSWEVISPDLTRNDKSKQQPSGGSLTKDITSVEYFDTIFSVAESPLQKGLLWVGTDDGLVQLTRDDGKTWANVTPKAMPEWSLVSLVEASPHDGGTAYVAVDRHKLDDLRPYIFKTSDYGKTWALIVDGIPQGAYVHAVREDPKRKGLLYAGTETGVYVSFNDGGNWQPLQLNLPTTPIHDLVVHGDDLVVATHGRSFWVLDRIGPLRQLTPQMAKEDVILYEAGTQYRLQYPEQFPRNLPEGENPPPGISVYYYFKSAPKGEVTLEFLDQQGKVVRRLSSMEEKEMETPPEWPDLRKPETRIPAEAGMNRFTWDMRAESPVRVPGEVLGEYKSRGPIVPPGTYSVRLTADGKSRTAALELKPDPRVKLDPAAIAKEYELELKIRDRLSELHQAINQIRSTRIQLRALSRLSDEPRFKPVLTSAQQIDHKMSPVEGEMLQVKVKSSESSLNYPTMIDERLHSLAGTVESADTAPTQQSYAVFEELSQQLDAQLGKWKQIVAQDIPALNDAIRAENVPVIYLGPSQAEQPQLKTAKGTANKK